MRNFYVVTNGQKDPDLTESKRIYTYLTNRGCNCVLQDQEQLENQHVNLEKVPENTECILVLGGDGTLIRAAGDVVDREFPLLGINLGTLGYLAEVKKNNIEEALEALIKDECAVEERMMLEGMVKFADGTMGCRQALNDIVITRCGDMKIVRYKIYVNGEHLYTYGADGIIISTPTGSTGYSMSAGGPIVSPKAKMLLITPICPHTLNSRSIILSSDDEVCVELMDDGVEGLNIQAFFDASDGIVLHRGESICIKKAKQTTKIVRINKESFLKTLRKKMSERE